MSLGEIAEPRRPGLYGDGVELKDGFAKYIERKLEDCDSQNEREDEEVGLEEGEARGAFNPVAQTRGQFRPKNEPQDGKSVKKRNDARGEADAAAIAGFAVKLGRKSVGGDARGLRLRQS